MAEADPRIDVLLADYQARHEDVRDIDKSIDIWTTLYFSALFLALGWLITQAGGGLATRLAADASGFQRFGILILALINAAFVLGITEKSSSVHRRTRYLHSHLGARIEDIGGWNPADWERFRRFNLKEPSWGKQLYYGLAVAIPLAVSAFLLQLYFQSISGVYSTRSSVSWLVLGWVAIAAVSACGVAAIAASVTASRIWRDMRPEMLWRVVLPPTATAKAINDPSFHALVAFARAMNVVRFCMEGIVEDLDPKRPADRRRRFGCMFMAGASLNDIRITSNSLGQWFGTLPAYAKLAAIWKGDPLGKPPLNALIKARDKAFAHFDPELPKTVFARETEIGELRWASGQGPARGNFYYELADEVTLHYILGEVQSEEEYVAKFDALLTALTETLLPLHHAGTELISEATRQLGARALRESSRDS
jgi:hypothetical protein